MSEETTRLSDIEFIIEEFNKSIDVCFTELSNSSEKIRAISYINSKYRIDLTCYISNFNKKMPYED